MPPCKFSVQYIHVICSFQLFYEKLILFCDEYSKHWILIHLNDKCRYLINDKTATKGQSDEVSDFLQLVSMPSS